MLSEREHTFFDVFGGEPLKKATANHFFCIKYGYDALNRITAATSDAGGNYNVSGITYDKNGNIITLNRNGWQNSSTFENMDVLSYDYYLNTNRLKNVNDSGNESYGFKELANTSIEYTYDANGNMLTDANKGIASNIIYNHLNLPTNVNLGSGTINYTYDALGNRLRKVANGITTDYAGNYVYENNELQFFSHNEGYVTPTGSGEFKYVYQYKDYLGNVRLSYTDNNNDGVINASNEIIEEKNYYPFGSFQKGYNSNYNPIGNKRAEKWGYNGKEFNDDNIGGKNLNWSDFGARNYDPSLGRWMNLDPLSEKYANISPYAFVANMPTIAVDPDGKRIVIIGDKKYQKAILSALLEMASTKEGLALFTQMVNSEDDVVIANFKNGKDPSKNHTRSSTRNKKGERKHWVNINTSDTRNFDDGTPRSLATSLGHELGHVKLTMEGRNNRNIATTKEALAQEKGAHAEEIENVHRENLIRAGLNMPLRDNYVGVPIKNMELSGKTISSDYGTLLEIRPKAKDMHFEYSTVPRASLNNYLQALKMVFGGHRSTNNLSKYNKSSNEFKDSVKNAQIIEKPKE
jgi:RHS repeat-associated protein